MTRKYYSARAGRSEVSQLNLDQARSLFRSTFESFERRFYFQEALGYSCVDEQDVAGTMGSDISAFFLRKLRKPDLWPISERITAYSQDDLFDVIELLYDHVSRPVRGRFHDFASCGWHYSAFDRRSGRNAFRREVNEFLVDYEEGFELSDSGEIQRTGGEGLKDLLSTPLPKDADPKDVTGRTSAAIAKFRSRKATHDELRDAVRDLADVLEFLRPQMKGLLAGRDEADLFQIANQFGIRHHNRRQKTDYDSEWLSWLFYHYLAGIHALTRMIAKRKDNDR